MDPKKKKYYLTSGIMFFVWLFLTVIWILHISLFLERLRNSFEIISKGWDFSLYIQTAPLPHVKNHSASSYKATCACAALRSSVISLVWSSSLLSFEKQWEVQGQTQVLCWGEMEKADLVNLLKTIRVCSFELLALCYCLWICSQQRSYLDEWERDYYLFVING